MASDAPLPFAPWLSAVFDHPGTKPAWYFDAGADWNGSPADRVACLTHLFVECGTARSAFSDAQIAQGLYSLIRPQGLESAFALLDTAVPLGNRLQCIAAMETLFAQCFARRCLPYLSHLIRDVAPEGLNALHGVCFLWWDVLPLHGLVQHRPDHPDGAQLDCAIMAVIARVLTLDSVACQESALFGLGYWSLYYPEPDALLEAFLVRHPALCEMRRLRLSLCTGLSQEGVRWNVVVCAAFRQIRRHAAEHCPASKRRNPP